VVEKAVLADLLVVNGDPITDIALLEKPDTNLAMIMKGGRMYKDVPKDRRPRLRPKSAFSCIPPVHRADFKGPLRVDLTRLPNRPATTAICALRSCTAVVFPWGDPLKHHRRRHAMGFTPGVGLSKLPELKKRPR
jgi:hypothetical protein